MEHGLVAYQILGNRECNHIVANILAADIPSPPPPPEDYSIGQKSSFTEHGHVAYQIKESRMQQLAAHILPADPTKPPSPDTGDGVKIQLFSEHILVAYQIEGNHGCSNMGANI